MPKYSAKTRYFFFIPLMFLFTNCESLIRKEFKKPADSLIEKKREIRDNIFLESIDRGNPDPSEDRTIYYKIYLNKELTAKTSSGLFFQRKKLTLNLAPGRYLFFAERWYLEDAPVEDEVLEYKRSNNVWQMKPIYIDVPETPTLFKMVFGIDHDQKEFYYEVEGIEKKAIQPDSPPWKDPPPDDIPDNDTPGE